MGESRLTSCPKCGTYLEVPAHIGGCNARCGQCKQRFYLPRPASTTPKPPTDADIAAWLTRDPDDPDQDAEPSLGGMHAMDAEPATTPISGDTAVMPAIEVPIRLVRLSAGGALLEFPASRLTDKDFRCAIPRECIRCRARSHLLAYPVIYRPELKQGVSLSAEHSTGSLRLQNHEVSGLSCGELLRRLPRVPNVPPPGDLPMPYYVCDMCTASKQILGQIQVNSSTGHGWCRLLIRNLRIAEKFLVNVGAEDTGDHEQIKQRLSAMEESPWNSVPQGVQNRLQQWYQPHPGEKFVAYIPDRDHGRSEDGMFGIVITNIRLIQSLHGRRRQTGVGDPLEIAYALETGKGRIGLKAGKWDSRMAVDREGIATLRKALTHARFNVNWV